MIIKTGKPMISGLNVKNIIVPKIEVIDDSALASLKVLSDSGVRVFFVDRVPTVSASGIDIECGFESVSVDCILDILHSDGGVLTDIANGKVIRGKFRDGEKVLHLLVNTDRADTEILFDSATCGEIFNPDDGAVTKIVPGEKIKIPAMRAFFVRI